MLTRRFGILLAALLLAAPSARATTFSFGDILSTDNITAITLAADDGAGGQTFDFDTSTNTITITSSVTAIKFSNKADITGIPIGDVIFSSQVSLNGSFTFVGSSNPVFTFGDFTNGAADFTIWDWAGGAVKVLEGDYQGAGLTTQLIHSGGVVSGEISGDFDVNGGDADAQAAFGATGSIDQIFSITAGFNLCTTVVVCVPAFNGFAIDWQSFTANPTSTLQATAPEPSNTLLLLSAVAAAFALRRAGPRR